MKMLNLEKWTIYVENNCKTVQEGNTLVVLDEDKNFVILFTTDEKKNILIQRCSVPCQCEIDYEQKTIQLELR